jgi:hypothetical protein
MTAQNVVALKAGAPILGIVPQNIDEIFRLAAGISKSGLAPKDMSTPEKVMVAILTGLEIGLPPMFAVQKIAVINGRPSLWGDSIPALLYAKGFKLREWMTGDGETMKAHCEIIRPTGDKIERSFSFADAKAAGLLTKPGPWQQYRPRMLQMRARGFCARDGAADVLGGMYLREELDEVEMRDITPATDDTPLPIPDIPEDIPAIEDMADVAQVEPDTIADVEGFLSKLTEDRAFVQSVEELNELAEANEEIIMRLPADAQVKAREILGVEE